MQTIDEPSQQQDSEYNSSLLEDRENVSIDEVHANIFVNIYPLNVLC